MSIKQVIEKLEVNLRPLALRDNLTPDAMDFYLRITGESASAKAYDYAKHKITSPLYQERAIFAGGCFWCMVEPFETKPGVISVKRPWVLVPNCGFKSQTELHGFSLWPSKIQPYLTKLHFLLIISLQLN